MREYDRYGINTICPSISRKMVSDSMRTSVNQVEDDDRD